MRTAGRLVLGIQDRARECARTDRTDRTEWTGARDCSLENGDCHHFPGRPDLPRMPQVVPPPPLSGADCGGKWWLSPFSSATKGFFASLRMTQGVGIGGAEPRAGRAMRFLAALRMTRGGAPRSLPCCPFPSCTRERRGIPAPNAGLGEGQAGASAAPVARRMTASWEASLRDSSPARRPSCMTRMRSHMPSTSGSSLEIISTATPLRTSSFMSL
jgi:hypothetical protein